MVSINSAKYILDYNLMLQECNAIYHAAAIKAGLSDCAFRILYMLGDAQKTFLQSEIAQEASMPMQTVNSALKKLQQNGLVTLEGTSRKSGKRISLTRAGEDFVSRHIAPVKKAENAVAESFSKEEIETFMHLLQTMVTRLREAINPSLWEEQ